MSRLSDYALPPLQAASGPVNACEALASHDVIILEDNDDAGRKKAREAAQALHGTAKTIRSFRCQACRTKVT